MKALFYASCLLYLSGSSMVFSQDKQTALSTEERFLIQRVTKFSKERDFTFIKNDIDIFLQNNPKTSIKDYLYLLLGDVAFQEGNYASALTAYQTISGELRDISFYREVLCYHKQNAFQALIDNANDSYSRLVAKNSLSSKDLKEIQLILAMAYYHQADKKKSSTERMDYYNKIQNLLQPLIENKSPVTLLLILAEACHHIGDRTQACEVYKLVAEQYPEHQVFALMQTAQIQASFDVAAASQTYQKIYPLNSNSSPLAAYQHCSLLFNHQAHAELIALKDLLQNHFAPDLQPVLSYSLGVSYLSTDSIELARENLEQALTSPQLSPDQKKDCLLALTLCAETLKDSPLFSKAIEALALDFPEDSTIAKAFLRYAHFCEEANQLDTSLQSLTIAIKRFPHLEERESVLFHIGKLQLELKQWENAHQTFTLFTQEFPSSAYNNLACRELVSCSLKQVAVAPVKKVKLLKEQLSQDLKAYLQVDLQLEPTDRADLHYRLSQTLFELESYDQAIKEFEIFLANNPHSDCYKTAEFLLAICYKSAELKEDLYQVQAEKALVDTSDLEVQDWLHLALFNSYLGTSQHDKAAFHLYEYALKSHNPIQVENEIWLMNYYLTQDQDLEKNDKILENLATIQKKAPLIDWKMPFLTLFELGKSYESQGNRAMALKIYQELHGDSFGYSVTSCEVALRLNKLLIAHYLPGELRKDAPQLTEILNSLKNLQSQRELLFEPLHLEAAMTYVEVKSMLSTKDRTSSDYLIYLTQLLEDFENRESVQAKTYHAAREIHPEKDKLFRCYMQYVQVEMLSAQAAIAKQDRQTAISEVLRSAALQVLLDIQIDNEVPLDLRARIDRSLQTLDKKL